jgi:hypothetical protein
MKTVQDYLNDPRIKSDPWMVGALEPIREIHAIRLKLQDETAGMTTAEETEYYKTKTAALFASIGVNPPQYVSFSGEGKLKA